MFSNLDVASSVALRALIDPSPIAFFLSCSSSMGCSMVLLLGPRRPAALATLVALVVLLVLLVLLALVALVALLALLALLALVLLAVPVDTADAPAPPDNDDT